MTFSIDSFEKLVSRMQAILRITDGDSFWGVITKAIQCLKVAERSAPQPPRMR